MQYKSLNQAKKSELQIAWKQCASLTHRAAGNFYYAFIFLPEKPRHGIQALYAFLRAGDDITDSEEDSNDLDYWLGKKEGETENIDSSCKKRIFKSKLSKDISYNKKIFDRKNPV